MTIHVWKFLNFFVIVVLFNSKTFCLEVEDIIIPGEIEVADAGHFLGTKPLHYDVRIKVHSEHQYSISVDIQIEVVEETRIILIHLNDTMLNMEYLPVLRTESNQAIGLMSNQKGDVLVLQTTQTLTPSNKYTLSFFNIMREVFQPGLDSPWTNDDGIYLTNDEYLTEKARRINDDQVFDDFWIWLILFEMRKARKAFPCYDLPNFKTTFQLCVTHDTDVTAFSNTKLEKKEEDGQMTKSCFLKTVVMSPYLFTFLIGKDVKSESVTLNLKGRELPLNIICHPYYDCAENASAWYKEFVPDAIVTTIDAMEEYTNFAYPLSKIDYAFAENYFQGAMENFGLIAAKMEQKRPESDLLVIGSKNVVVHETVHQWMGNLVTNRDWRGLCLQEGMTTFLAQLLEPRSMPETHLLMIYANGSDLGFNRTGMDMLELKTAGKCYLKIPISFAMLGQHLGMEKLKGFLTQLLKDCAYKSCNLDEWLQSLTKVHNEESNNITRMFESAMTSVGYPIITIRLVESNETAADILYMTQHHSHALNHSLFAVPYSYSQFGSQNTKGVYSAVEHQIKVYLTLDNNDWFDINSPSGDKELEIYGNTFWGVILYPLRQYVTLSKCLNQSLEYYNTKGEVNLLIDSLTPNNTMENMAIAFKRGFERYNDEDRNSNDCKLHSRRIMKMIYGLGWCETVPLNIYKTIGTNKTQWTEIRDNLYEFQFDVLVADAWVRKNIQKCMDKVLGICPAYFTEPIEEENRYFKSSQTKPTVTRELIQQIEDKYFTHYRKI